MQRPPAKLILAPVVAAAVAASAVLLLFNPTNQPSDDIHSGHDIAPGSYPVDLQHYYSKEQTLSQSVYGIDYAKVYRNWVNTEISCDLCTRVEYIPSPQNNTELAVGGNTAHNFKDVKKLSFFVMGQTGNEVIAFKALGKNYTGVNGPSVKYDIITVPVHLSKSWKRIEIDVAGRNITAVTSPLSVKMEYSTGQLPLAFYIKGLRFDSAPPITPIEQVQLN